MSEARIVINAGNVGHAGGAGILLGNRQHGLYFCRTPLQSLIIQEIIRRQAGYSTVIYHPTGSSAKHHFYFNRLICTRKVFVPWRYFEFSDTLSDIVAWWDIPIQIREQRYSDLFIASIGSIAFSMLIVRNQGASVNTFDDGTFNISPNVFLQNIWQEPPLRKWIKVFLKGVTNLNLIRQGKRHYTIFRSKDVVGIPYEINEIILSERGCEVNAPGTWRGRKVRVLLGTVFRLANQRNFYECLVTSERFDVFLPHPAENRVAIVKPWVQESCASLDLQNMIAEDAVLELLRVGLNPKIYAFNSTALFTLARFVDTVNLQVIGLHVELSPELLQEMGVRTLRIAATVTPDQ